MKELMKKKEKANKTTRAPAKPPTDEEKTCASRSPGAQASEASRTPQDQGCTVCHVGEIKFYLSIL